MNLCCLTTKSFRRKPKRNKSKCNQIKNCCVRTRFLQAVKNKDLISVNELCDEIHNDNEILIDAIGVALTIECNGTLPIVSMLLNRVQEMPISLIRLSVSHTLEPEIFALLVKKWVQIDEKVNPNNVAKICFLSFLRTLLFESRYMFGDRQFRFICAIREQLNPYWPHALQHAISARGCQYRLYRMLIAYTDHSNLQSCLNHALFTKNEDAIRALSFCPFLRVETFIIYTRSASVIRFRGLLYRIRGMQRFRAVVRSFLERHYAPGGKGYKKTKDRFSHYSIFPT